MTILNAPAPDASAELLAYRRTVLDQLSTVETYLRELRVQQAELEAERRRLQYLVRNCGYQPQEENR